MAPCHFSVPVSPIWFVPCLLEKQEKLKKGLPDGPVIGTPHFHCRWHKFSPSQEAEILCGMATHTHTHTHTPEPEEGCHNF